MPSTVKMLPVVSLHVLCGSAMLHESMCFFFTPTMCSFQPTRMQGSCQCTSLYGSSRHP